MRRFVAGGGLCLLLIALVVGFGAQFNGTDAYPDSAAVDDDYADHVGERIHFWGFVVGERDGSLLVDVGAFRLAVSAPPPSAADPGDQIQVYGELRPDRRMETHAYHVQTVGERRYMYAVSVVGLALAAVAFLRRWRVDADRLRFVLREDH